MLETVKTFKLAALVLCLACCGRALAVESFVLAERGKAVSCSIEVRSDWASARYAAKELTDFTERLTGVRLAQGAVAERCVVLEEGDAALGEDGFRLFVEGNRLHVVGGVHGVLYGVYEILERFGGIEWLSPERTVIPRLDALSVPGALDETQRPAFETREPLWWVALKDPDFSARLRMSGHYVRLKERHGGKTQRYGDALGLSHTFGKLVPAEKYAATHPEYYALRGGKRLVGTRTQLCLSNPDVRKIATATVLEAIRTDPTARYFSVKQNDNMNYCQCPVCAAIDAEEGSPAGSLVRFVNAIAEEVEKVYPDKVLVTAAYQYGRRPPRKTRLRKNAMIDFSTIECDFAHPIETGKDPENVSIREDIRGWLKMADRLYVWDYTTAFAHYPGIFPDFDVLQSNIRFFRSCGATHLVEQGAYQGLGGEFEALKAWLFAKWMWNPDLDEKALLDRFFRGYYGKAAPYVRKYFDRLRALPREDGVFRLGCFTGQGSEAIVPNQFLEKARKCFDLAEAAVRDDDPVVRTNVLMAAFSVDYVRFLRKMGVYAPATFSLRRTPLGDEAGRADFQATARRLKAMLDAVPGIVFSESRPNHAEVVRDIARAAAAPSRPPEPKDRVVFEETALTRAGASLVDDATASGGKALKFTADDFQWCATMPLPAAAFDAGVTYRMRVRAKFTKRPDAIEGNVLNCGVFDEAKKTNVGDWALKESQVADGTWEWLDLGTWKPTEHQRLWFSSGVFDRAKDGTNRSISAFYLDQFEISRADHIEVAAYYFGNYHRDRRNEAFHGKGWNEWKLVKEAKPRFEGHYQPRVPVWGCEDEADPQAMARKIDAAAEYGVDAFIFDWYYYEDGPFLERSLDEGFLNAPNNDKVKFALMWANHDWTDIHPKRRAVKKPRLLYPGKVSPERFDRICDLVIARYLKHPSYWKVDGMPYFSIYELPKFLENFGGSADAAKAALERFRRKAVAAGLPGLHLNTIYCGQRILPNETSIKDVFELTKYLGFDSATSYTWLHHVEMTDLKTKFDFVRDGYFRDWASLQKRFRIPYIPNASVGWDSSPRADQRDEYGNFGYPFCAVIVDNGPDRFREALELIRKRLDADPSQPRIVTVNSWNEWTEGSYLEPDEKYGYGYLEAIRSVFGRGAFTIAERGRPCGCAIEVKAPGESVAYAAQELSSYVKKLTGVSVPVGGAAERRIVLEAGDAALGTDGFEIEAKDGVLSVRGGKRGILYGVYEILERFGGVGWFSSWHEVVPRLDRLEVPDGFRLTEKPAFPFREVFWKDPTLHPEFNARLRLNNRSWQEPDEKTGGNAFRFGGGLGNCHTFHKLLPPEKYFDSHPEYFSLVDGRRRKTRTQLCLTNPEVLGIVTSNLLSRIRKDPDAQAFTVDQQDWENYCTCEACRAIDEAEGSPSATLIRFVNRVAEAVEREFPGKFVKTSAYQYTKKPPKTIAARDNVLIDISTDSADAGRPLRTSPYPKSVDFVQSLQTWARRARQLAVWDYTTDYHHYLLPFPNVGAFQDNLRLFRENGVAYVFEQGDHTGYHGEFGELKAWLLAQWAWDPERPAEPLLNRFFRGYYGAAAPLVRRYFDDLHAVKRDGLRQPLYFYDQLSSLEVYPEGFFEKAADLWRQAEAAVAGDPARLYNVRMSAMPVDYVLFTRYGKLVAVSEAASRLGAVGVQAARRLESAMAEAARAGRTVAFSDTASKDKARLKRLHAVATGEGRLIGKNGAVTLEEGAFGVVGPREDREIVDDPGASDGKACRLTNSNYQWYTTYELDQVAFEPGKRYVLSVRVRADATGEPGEVFSAGVSGAGISRSFAAADLKDGYAWYDVAEWVPGQNQSFYIAPGRFDQKKFGRSPAHNGVWVDAFAFREKGGGR